MKDFIKWLGVNEKVAKVAVWMLIFMVFLIVINTALNSLGFPHYAITYDNLKNINTNMIFEAILSVIITILNFYVIILLVFRIKQIKSIFKYSILYLILNFMVINIFNQAFLQIFIMLYCLIFCYIFSSKQKKYIIYGVMSIIINTIIQGICYIYKVQFLDYSSLNRTTQTLLSFDYFIIMAVIILVKEIYIKKRGEKNGFPMEFSMVGQIRQRKQNR